MDKRSKWNKDITVGFAYEYVDLGKAVINQFKGDLLAGWWVIIKQMKCMSLPSISTGIFS